MFDPAAIGTLLIRERAASIGQLESDPAAQPASRHPWRNRRVAQRVRVAASRHGLALSATRGTITRAA